MKIEDEGGVGDLILQKNTFSHHHISHMELENV